MPVPADLAAWRKALRRSLLDSRSALPQNTLAAYRESIDFHLQRAFPDLVHGPVAFCWPYKNEYDARHLLAGLRAQGLVTALPVVVAPRTPLVFREWRPGVAMTEGPLGIPFPSDTPEIEPRTVLLPVVGFDAAGYRLGYGGGYFDRTLAALPKRPRVIGTAYEMALIPTIYPQWYDQPLDFVVTERGVYERVAGALLFLGEQTRSYSSPACLAAEIAPGYFGEKPE